MKKPRTAIEPFSTIIENSGMENWEWGIEFAFIAHQILAGFSPRFGYTEPDVQCELCIG